MSIRVLLNKEKLKKYVQFREAFKYNFLHHSNILVRSVRKKITYTSMQKSLVKHNKPIFLTKYKQILSIVISEI